MTLHPDDLSSDEARWEDDRVDELKLLVDGLCQKIMGQHTQRSDLEQQMSEIRLAASLLCPDRLDLFDLIYESRFERLLEQFPPGD